MLRTPAGRAIAVLVLTLALTALVVGYGATTGPTHATVDDELSSDATAADQSTSERALAQSDVLYLYGISLVGALWVAGRLLQHWRLDSHDLALTPATDEESHHDA